jgi:hypothetical protein
MTNIEGEIMSEMTQTEILKALCMDHLGEHYESTSWGEACNDEYDWADHYPIIDGDGLLTGEVYETGMWAEPYANVDDAAMVLISDLSADEQRRIASEQNEDVWDGYAVVPAPRGGKPQ